MIVAAVDVAHDRTDRRHDDALIDLVLPADRGDHDGRVLRRDLNDGAQLLRDFPAFDLGVDRRVRRFRRLGESRCALALGEVASRVDLQVDVAAGESALEFERGDARRNQRHVIGVAVEVVVVGRQRPVPHALAELGDQFGGEPVGFGARGARLAVDAGALHRGAHDADRIRRGRG